MTWWLIGLGYYFFGLLLMDYMCPCWPMFEKMIGALIWPISLAIGIRITVKER